VICDIVLSWPGLDDRRVAVERVVELPWTGTPKDTLAEIRKRLHGDALIPVEPRWPFVRHVLASS
jgi:hypothetical protein